MSAIGLRAGHGTPAVCESTEPARGNNRRSTGRIRELDGIRGLAILLVLIFHYVVEIAQVKRDWVVYLRLSWSGVDLFFVLSGFLIGGILLDARESKEYFPTFYLRRFHRIVPLYFMWVAIFVAGVYCVGPGSAAPLKLVFNRSIPLWSYPLFLQNFLFTLHNIYGSPWMSMSWSLAVEEQFYLLLPLAIRRMNPGTLTRFLLVTVLLAPVLRILLLHVGTHDLGGYVLLPCRADSLGCGVLMALAYRDEKTWSWLCSHRRYIYACFLVFGVGVALWSVRDLWIMNQIGYSWMAGLYTSLLLLVLANPGRLERLLFGNGALVWLGTVAYAVYLFHSGILHIYHYICFGAFPGIHNLATFGVTALSLVTVMILAEVSWRVLEKPLIQHAHARYRY